MCDCTIKQTIHLLRCQLQTIFHFSRYTYTHQIPTNILPTFFNGIKHIIHCAFEAF